MQIIMVPGFIIHEKWHCKFYNTFQKSKHKWIKYGTFTDKTTEVEPWYRALMGLYTVG